MDDEQTERLIEMIRWLTENPAAQCLLCDADVEDRAGILSLLEELEARGYWEFLLILLLRSRHWRFVGEAMDRFMAEKALADLRCNGLRRELAAFARLLARPAL